MRIAEIHVYQVDLPLSGKHYRMSEGSYATLDSTIVEIVSDTGISGWGETCPVGPTYQPEHAPGARAALHQMSPNLIGRSVTGPLALRRSMDKLLNGHNYAKAAIDIAVHDLIGKAHGMRVCDMLGGATSERVSSYYALTVDQPDEVARTAVEKIAEGYPRLQIKVGGRPVELDIETIRKVWEATGCTRLSVDANRALTTRDVLRIGRECADIPFVLRAALQHHGGDRRDPRAAAPRGLPRREHRGPEQRAAGDLARDLRRVRAQGHAPRRARRHRDGPGPLRSALHAAHLRRLVGGDIIAAACVHVGATVQPRLLEGVWLAEPYMDVHYDSGNPVRIEGGHIQVPTGPGLGVVPDEGVFGEPVASFG